MTGELRRGFLKHKVYGTVFAVEQDETGMVLAALAVNEASTCKHQLADYQLELDAAVEIAQHLKDFEVFEPVCSDPVHLLAEIGEQEKVCRVAEAEWTQAHAKAKALKEVFELHVDQLRALVGNATSPKPLPLFDQPAA